MIKNHILALLSLVAAAISGTESILQFCATGIGSGSGWLMLLVFVASFYFYIRFKKVRREMMQQGKR
ncbi:hypothetical protein LBMAG26_01190 [Bacteroidota bacterium]|nr:hypothetical protein LBMAG26_01190 [Bacteroidota bacterium]